MAAWKFSVIIPVYNVKDYLCQCVDSVLAQTYTNYEVLLVDDGSTDGSSALCDSYSDRARVFHKPNGGLSDARNYGIDRAQGEFLVFVDSDDWIAPDALENMNRALDSRADMLVTTLIEYFENDKSQRVNDRELMNYVNSHKMDKSDVIDWACRCSKNTWTAQKYVVSSDFVEKNRLRFAKGRLHEDVDWTARCFYVAETFAFMDQPWYYHRLNRADSIMSNKGSNVKNSMDMIEMARQHYDCPEGFDARLHRTIFDRFMSSLFACLRRGKRNSKNDNQKLAACMKENKCIFSLSHAPKAWNKLFVIFYKLFGGRAALGLLKLL